MNGITYLAVCGTERRGQLKTRCAKVREALREPPCESRVAEPALWV